MAFDKHASPDTKQYHIQVARGEVGRYVFLPGDPFRTDLIASFLEDAKLIAHNREHKTWTGTLCGEKVSVTSTGMGCPSTAIAVEELIKAGADTFIRIGTAGPVRDSSDCERYDGVIVTAAVRDEYSGAIKPSMSQYSLPKETDTIMRSNCKSKSTISIRESLSTVRK